MTVDLLNNVFSGLGIKAKCVKHSCHRHFCFYDIVLEPSTKVRKIESFSREIALGIKSRTAPIVSLIPEEGIVRLKFAFKEADVLDFNAMKASYQKPSGVLPLLLGETDQGDPMWVEMSAMPHVLIAGGTGSGKSTLLHTIISNVIKDNSVWLYLLDPKRTEFATYQSKASYLGHSYFNSIALLNMLTFEMETRYKMLQTFGLRSIEDSPNIFPKILVVIDEVSDLILQDQNKTFENQLALLAQKSRAAGIYIVLATQRPSVDVITGLIKANFPARISCKVSSAVDSKVILDQPGAELLMGRGDALICSPKHSMVRFQVAKV